MPHIPGRPRSKRASGGAGGARRPKDAFQRVFKAIGRLEEREIGASEARERISDVVRLAGRMRQLERRLGRSGTAELSPYLQSLLRLAAGPRIVEPARLRKAVSF